MSEIYARKNIDNAWCPGCGNFGILELLKQALEELEADKRNVLFVSGIGQAAKTPHYLDVNMFDVLHGRALPAATGAKLSNPNLNIIAEGGDGDMYGEGGNHFLNAVRRNIDIAHIVHNNMVYGLTKGQASPTSQKGFRTGVQVEGVFNEPFNPLSVAISLGASFVSRIYMGHHEHALEVIKAAILHRGYALVDIFQPCVTFNKLNTYDWFEENSYILKDHDSSDRESAWKRAKESYPFPLGVFYKEERETLDGFLWSGQEKHGALHGKLHNKAELQEQFDKYY